MPKRIRLHNPDLAQAVATALETCQNVKDQRRLLAMRLVASGEYTAEQIAEHLEVSRRQLFNWRFFGHFRGEIHWLKAG